MTGDRTSADGTLPEGRDPKPKDRYSAWTQIKVSGVSSMALAPPWVVLATLASVASLGVALIALGPGPISGLLVLVAGDALLLLFVRTWLIVTARVHNYLLRRPELGDVLRLAIVSLAFVGIPVVTALLGIVTIGLVRAVA